MTEQRQLVCRDTRAWVHGEKVTWNHCVDCYEYECPIYKINERLSKLEEAWRILEEATGGEAPP